MTKSPTAAIGELVRIVGGGTPTRSKAEYYGGDIPWVTPKDMKSWDISDSQIRITQRGLDNSAARIAPSNSVLIVVRSGVLKHTVPIGLNRRPVAINQDMKALICSDSLSPDYLAHYLKERSSTILSWVRATTADNFPVAKLRELTIPLPPLTEQREIVGQLEVADILRAKRRRAVALQESLVRSIFLDMFGESAEAYPTLTVEEVADPTKGSIRTGPFGSQLLHGEFVDSGIAVLGIDNAVNNEFRWAERRYITEGKYRHLSRYTVYSGDVLITIMGTCGRCAVVPEDIPTAINTKHLCCITLDRSRCLPEYLHSYFLWHPIAQTYLRKTAQGAIMSGLNMSIIKDLPIVLPSTAVQLEYVSRLEAIQALKSFHMTHLDRLDNLFASLQHRAFSGELAVSGSAS
jgi:type I restriction enzyme, S subunit